MNPVLERMKNHVARMIYHGVEDLEKFLRETQAARRTDFTLVAELPATWPKHISSDGDGGGLMVAAAVGGRSMAHTVQQGSRRVLAALEASGLAAPPMESPSSGSTSSASSASSRPSTRGSST